MKLASKYRRALDTVGPDGTNSASNNELKVWFQKGGNVWKALCSEAVMVDADFRQNEKSTHCKRKTERYLPNVFVELLYRPDADFADIQLCSLMCFVE